MGSTASINMETDGLPAVAAIYPSAIVSAMNADIETIEGIVRTGARGEDGLPVESEQEWALRARATPYQKG